MRKCIGVKKFNFLENVKDLYIKKNNNDEFTKVVDKSKLSQEVLLLRKCEEFVKKLKYFNELMKTNNKC